MDLQPKEWTAFVGQERLKDRLQIAVNGALSRNQPMDHVLLVASPGQGKSSIAPLLAAKLETNYASYIMPIKPQRLRHLVQGFTGVCLFDECHRLKIREQEQMLSLLQDHYLQLDNGGKIYAGYLTIVAATTEPQDLIQPFIDRFPIRPETGCLFDDYTDEEMGQIIQGMGEKMGLNFSNKNAMILAQAACGVPRNCTGLVSMARDLKSTDPKLIFQKCRITPEGLTELHLRYIETLNQCGGETGLINLINHAHMPKATILGLERLLSKRQLIDYSSTGRSLTEKGYEMLAKYVKVTY